MTPIEGSELAAPAVDARTPRFSPNTVARRQARAAVTAAGVNRVSIESTPYAGSREPLR
jgi:hypothetical protein